MAYDYDKAARTADRLVKKFGAVVTLNKYANLGTASRPDYAVATTHDIYAAKLDDVEKDPDTLVTNRVTTFYISPLNDDDVVPASGDEIIAADGVSYELDSVDILKPTATAVLYTAKAKTP